MPPEEQADGRTQGRWAVLVGAETLHADAQGGISAAALREAIGRANAAARIDGVADTLNPDTIDPAKALPLVAALPAQPAAVRDRLAGHALFLAWEELGLLMAAPTGPDTFAAPHALHIDEVQGATVLAHVPGAVDPALARTQAEAAQAALARAAGRSGPLDVAARRQCAAFARCWRLNAQAWSGAEPGSRAARRAVAAAEAAAETHAMPRGARP